MSMGGDEGSGERRDEGWKSETVADDLRAWFCQLSTQERLQVRPRQNVEPSEKIKHDRVVSPWRFHNLGDN